MEDSTKNEPIKFRSPPRIIIPALVESRDKWKEKAQRRNDKLKDAQIHIRDLAQSRKSWKQRVKDTEAQLLALQEELVQTQLLLEKAHERITSLERPDEKKIAKPS